MLALIIVTLQIELYEHRAENARSTSISNQWIGNKTEKPLEINKPTEMNKRKLQKNVDKQA